MVFNKSYLGKTWMLLCQFAVDSLHHHLRNTPPRTNWAYGDARHKLRFLGAWRQSRLEALHELGICVLGKGPLHPRGNLKKLKFTTQTLIFTGFELVWLLEDSFNSNGTRLTQMISIAIQTDRGQRPNTSASQELVGGILRTIGCWLFVRSLKWLRLVISTTVQARSSRAPGKSKTVFVLADVFTCNQLAVAHVHRHSHRACRHPDARQQHHCSWKRTDQANVSET